MKEFNVTVRKGIDDLTSESPYCNAHDWPTFCPIFDITEEEYIRDNKSYEDKVRAKNTAYIAKLKEEGQYGEKSTKTFKYSECKEFDKNEQDKIYLSHLAILIPKGTLGDKGLLPKFTVKYNGDENKKDK